MSLMPGVVGTVTFLFTDLEGSTRMWEQHPDAMKAALPQHDAILRSAIEGSGGHVVKTTGDGLMAVFTGAAGAVAASLAAQRDLALQKWSETGPLRVRMGVHSGQADERAGDYFGPTVNRAARIMAAGHGGQVLLSAAAGALAQDELPTGASLIDLGEHRLKDLDRPEHVFQLRHADLTSDFPPLATVKQVTADIPARLSAMIGRESELGQIKAILADPQTRLLTLTGPGGTGKTTIAVRVAEELEATYRDGAAFVDLSSARDTTTALAAIARAVGLDDVVERPLRDELAKRFAGRTMLLVLDNMEQVTEAAGSIAQILRDSPGVTVLATSREALHVRVERVFQIPPLDLPPASLDQQSAAEVNGFDSVRLFVDRARAVRREFELTDENAAAVADICRRLDGLPLAIELAAARLRLFSPEVLRDRLGDRLGLLRSGPRDLPERQQTLRAAMDWSYELLDPAERLLFEILGVFAEADVTAVESVTDGMGQTDGISVEPLDGLGSLVDKSLVRQVDVPGSEPRVTMLETIREFARDRLNQRPEIAERARRAHAVHYLELANRLRPELAGNRRQTALAQLAADSANLRLCWTYWVGEGDLAALNNLAGPLMTLDDDRGWYLNTVALTTDMLAVLDASPPSAERAGQEIALRTSLARALMATRGVTREVEDALTRALDLFEQGGDTRQHYSVLRGLASLYLFRGQVDQSALLGQEILDLGERENDIQMQVDGHLLVGVHNVTGAHVDAGIEHLDNAIALFEGNLSPAPRSVRVGNDPRVACYTSSALALQMMGYPARAIGRAESALAFAASLDHPFTTAYARFHVGLVHLFMRDWQSAHNLGTSLLEVAEEHGFRIWIATGRCLLGAARVGVGRIDDGLADIESGMALYQELRSPPTFWPFLLFVGAGAYHRAGRSAEGLPRLDRAIELLSSPPPGGSMLPELLLLKGDALGADGPQDAARWSEVDDLYRRGYERADELGARGTLLRAAIRLARHARTDEEKARALSELSSVYTTFADEIDTADLIESRELLAANGSR